MSVKLTREEFLRVKDRDFSSDEEMLAALQGRDVSSDTETAAALGEGYPIGNAIIPPLSLGILPLLEAIKSPFLDPEQNEYGTQDLMYAVFIMAMGRDAVRPIFSVNRRREALRKLKEMAEKTPEMFDRYLIAVQAVEEDWVEFEENCAAFWETVGPANLKDIAETVVRALSDAFGGLAALPADPQTDKKKKRAATRNG